MNEITANNKRHADKQGNDVEPWYRQPWFFIVFGLPAIAVVASLVTLGISIQNRPNMVSENSAKNRISAVLAMSAKERGISAEVGFNSQNYIEVIISAKDEITDLALSAIMIETSELSSDKIAQIAKAADKKAANRGNNFFAFELIADKNQQSLGNAKKFISSKPISAEMPAANPNKKYWLEITGYKAAWSLNGTLSSAGFIDN